MSLFVDAIQNCLRFILMMTVMLVAANHIHGYELRTWYRSTSGHGEIDHQWAVALAFVDASGYARGLFAVRQLGKFCGGCCSGYAQ